MKSDTEQKIADEALATLQRLRSSTELKHSGEEIAVLGDKMGDTKTGWSASRHNAWIATCHLRDGLQGRKEQPNLPQLWADAITKTESWVRAV